MTKDELRKFCAVHYRAAVARETRAEWNRAERPAKTQSVRNPLRRDPDTYKRWAQE